MAASEDMPPYLPPRRPSSMPNLNKKRSSGAVETPPPFLPPRKPHTASQRRSVAGPSPLGPRPISESSIPDKPLEGALPLTVGRTSSEQRRRLSKHQSRSITDGRLRDSRLQAIVDGEQVNIAQNPPSLRTPPPARHSSLRIATSISEDQEESVQPASTLATARSEPQLRYDHSRPHSHPPSKLIKREDSHRATAARPSMTVDPQWRDSRRIQPPAEQDALSISPAPSPRPRSSFQRYSSLDNLMTYREEKAAWKRESLVSQHRISDLDMQYTAIPEKNADLDNKQTTSKLFDEKAPVISTPEPSETASTASSANNQSKFRHPAREAGFCFSIAVAQFLGEYLITGFAMELPRLVKPDDTVGPGALGTFWPASLLSLVLSATLLIFARLSDMYSGYPIFIGGLVWLSIWTLVPGFFTSLIVIDISRAMQGLALAAFTPSTFAMVSSYYKPGPRKNFVMGLYSGCAPLGFFAGFLAAGALPGDSYHWYFWIASALSCIAAVVAYLAVPHDTTDRKILQLEMDWLGAFFITSGLILIAYALAIEPYVNQFELHRSAFTYPTVLGPLVSGVLCLAIAIWVEGWYAKCPLLPFQFFKPRGVTALCFAGVCLYASYGVWLYNSAQFFQSMSDPRYGSIQGMKLAVWYAPTAIGGLILCVVGGALLHIVPTTIILLISGLAWIAAPLLLAVCPLPLDYWSVVLPSMLCATIGIDLTYTVSIVFLSGVQPKDSQGLAGAISSILINLAMSFSLPISEIISSKVQASATPSGTEMLSATNLQAALDYAINSSYRAAFLYGAASAGVGFLICVLFVRIPRSVMSERTTDEESGRTSSEASTLVDERSEHGDTSRGSQEVAQR